MARFDRDNLIQQCVDACEGSGTPREGVQAVIERTMWRGDPPQAEPFDADALEQVLERAASLARTLS